MIINQFSKKLNDSNVFHKMETYTTKIYMG